MSPRAKGFLRLVFSLGLSVLFLYLAFRNASPDELLASLQGVNYWWLAMMFILLLASHAFRSLRWRFLLNPIKPGIGFRNLFSAVMVGYMMNNVLPRAGELVRPYAIGKLENIRAGAALGTIVVERLLDILTFLGLIALIPFVYEGPLMQTFPWLEQGGLWLGIVTMLVLVALVMMMIRRDWTDAVLRLLTRFLPMKLRQRLEGLAHAFLDGLLFVKQPRALVVIMVLGIVVWGLYGLMTYVAFFAFDMHVSLGPGAALVVLAISSIGVAIPTPGSTGTYHFFTSVTLTRLFGVASGPALSYATATHAVGFVGVTLIGLYFFVKDQLKMSDAVAQQGRD
jgi:glycosyltransferase 2 family protein